MRYRYVMIGLRTVCIVLVLLLMACNKMDKNSFGYAAQDIGITVPALENFVVEKNLVRKGGKYSFQTIKARNGSEALKVEIISPVTLPEARNMIRERLRIVHSLYTNLPSPYPGAVTKKITYPKELRPQYQVISTSSQTFPLYLLASNERYIYGAMTEELIVHRGFLSFVYNPKKQALIRMDYFVPKERYQKEDALKLASSITFKETIDTINLAQEVPGDKPQKPVSEEKKTIKVAVKSVKNDLNVILIGFEPLGSNHVGCYGYKKDTTPHLDAFAKDSFLFQNVISPSSWTLPVFMSWFTSLYPTQHGIVNKYSEINGDYQKLSNLTEISPQAITLAEVMKESGYQTAGFTGGAGVSGDFGYSKGFDTYYDKVTFAGFDSTMPMALDWLKEHRQEKFFLFVQGYDVHGRFPLDAKASEKFLYKEYKGKLKGTTEEYWQLRNTNINDGKIGLSEEDVTFLQSVYDAKISASDERFGEFIEGLKRMNLLDNTLIIISSGSGNEYYEHQRLDHGFSLYEELIQVPLIIRMPGEVGSTRSLVRTIDIMPTILDVLKIETPVAQKQVQGISLLPLIKGKELKLDGFAETDYLLQSFKRSITSDGRWKFIISLDTDERELYNLNTDPTEQVNVLEKEGRTAYELEQKLFLHLSKMKRR